VTETKNAVAAEGQELAGTAVEQASAFAGEVKTQAGSALRDARQQLEQKADDQARRIGSGMQDARRHLETMAEGADDGLVPTLARQLASSLGNVSETIEQGGIGALSDEVRSFARRQPGLFLLGAGATGFLVARLLRHAGSGLSSGPTRSDQSGPSPGTLPAPSATEAAGEGGSGPRLESDLAHAGGSAGSA
jgi:uncharacterized protein YjeT (DUF2065 family)